MWTRHFAGRTAGITKPAGRTAALIELALPRTKRYESPVTKRTRNSRWRSEPSKRIFRKTSAARTPRETSYRKELQMENKGPFINELPPTGK